MAKYFAYGPNSAFDAPERNRIGKYVFFDTRFERDEWVDNAPRRKTVEFNHGRELLENTIGSMAVDYPEVLPDDWQDAVAWGLMSAVELQPLMAVMTTDELADLYSSFIDMVY